MTILLIIAGFFVSFSTALFLTPSLRQFAIRNNWVDEPDGKRKVHHTPIPNVGGLAILIAFIVGIAFFHSINQFLGVGLTYPSWMMLFGGAFISMVGLYDDVKGLGFKRKFVAQIFVSCLMVHAGYRIDMSDFFLLEGDPYLQNAYSMLVTLLWYVGIMNAINLIDGLDGLAGGISVIAFGTLALVFNFSDNLSSILIVMAITGAITGFLVHNFNPASIFMGDSGSLFIGFLLATYALEGTSHRDPILALVVLAMAIGLPILDTGVAFLRRLMEGKSPFFPDSDHIHHRLTRNLNLSPRVAVLLLYTVNIALGAQAIFLVIVDPSYSALIMGITLLLIYVLLRRLGYIKVRDIVAMMDSQFERRQRVPIPANSAVPANPTPAPSAPASSIASAPSQTASIPSRPVRTEPNGHSEVNLTVPYGLRPSSDPESNRDLDVLQTWTEEAVRDCWNEVDKEMTRDLRGAIRFVRTTNVVNEEEGDLSGRTAGKDGVAI